MTQTMHNKTCALIIVDMSVEQVSELTHHKDEVIDNIRILILGREGGGVSSVGNQDAASPSEPRPRSVGGFDLIVDSRLWLSDPSQSSLAWVWEDTAKSLFVADSPGASLIPELSNVAHLTTFVPKYNYSCFAGDSCQLGSLLQSHKITHVALAGINTDYCIFATALDAFQRHIRTVVVTDAVSSVRGQEAHDEGLRNLARHLGPHALCTTDDVFQRLLGRNRDAGDAPW